MSKRWNKYLRYITMYVIAACVIFTSGCRKYIELTDNYTWKEVKLHSDITVIVNSNGEIIIGPGGIELWAEYPWIYGMDGEQKTFFAINMKSGEVIHIDNFYDFCKKHNINYDLHLLATICDVTMKRDTSGRINTRGDELKKACMPNR